MSLSKEQIAGLPKGDYMVINKGNGVQQLQPTTNYRLTSEGGFIELLNEYDLILQKKSKASATHRLVIREKMDLLKKLIKNKREWHRIVYPWDYSGELTRILRS